MIDFSFSDDAELQKLSAQVVSLLTTELLHALSQIACALDQATY